MKQTIQGRLFSCPKPTLPCKKLRCAPPGFSEVNVIDRWVNGIDSIRFWPTPIPEPSTWLLLGLGGIGLLVGYRRLRKGSLRQPATSRHNLDAP
jgi:hypothetical protein